MSQIKIENLNLWYEKGKPIEVHALKNVDMSISKGDYVALFGPSGCGKTTMLYSISGIDRFQEGKILIDGRDISSLTNEELAVLRQTGIGIVFQQFNLIPSLTVLKNVALPMLFVGVSSKKAEEEASKLINRLGLSQFAYRYPHELSGGQQQRVGIARALANNPPIIIADEPLGNLDSANAKIVLDFLKELNEKDGRTIIMVTHEAWSLRDVNSIYHMKDGVIGGVEEIKNNTVIESLSKHLYDQISSVSGAQNSLEEKVGEEKISIRILANFFLRGYSMEEIMRFEVITDDRLSGKIDKKELYRLMNLSFKKGGIGLRRKKANKITHYIEKIIEMKEKVKGIYKLLEKKPDLSIAKEVNDIRNWLVEEYRGELSPVQLVALDEVIADRIKGFTNTDKVVEVLDLSKNKFGVGLSFRASQLISEKLELILDNDSTSFNSNNYLPEEL